MGKNCIQHLYLTLTLSLQEWFRRVIPAHWKTEQGDHKFLNSLATEKALKDKRSGQERRLNSEENF